MNEHVQDEWPHASSYFKSRIITNNHLNQQSWTNMYMTSSLKHRPTLKPVSFKLPPQPKITERFVKSSGRNHYDSVEFVSSDCITFAIPPPPER